MSRALKLDRPLVVLDLETTGVNPREDRIVQMAFLKLKPDGTRTNWSTLINPGVHIPPEATDVHGITDAEVESAPAFASVAPRVARALEGCDIAGFNVRRFDWPLLQAELRRAGVAFEWQPRILDALQVFYAFHPRDLSAAVKVYCGREHVSAHDAVADVEASLEVLEAQLERHEELPLAVGELVDWLNPRDPNAIDSDGKFKWAGDVPTVAFGKHLGLPMEKVDRGFFRWIASGDFPEDTKAIAREAAMGRFPVKEQEAQRAV